MVTSPARTRVGPDDFKPLTKSGPALSPDDGHESGQSDGFEDPQRGSRNGSENVGFDRVKPSAYQPSQKHADADAEADFETAEVQVRVCRSKRRPQSRARLRSYRRRPSRGRQRRWPQWRRQCGWLVRRWSKRRRAAPVCLENGPHAMPDREIWRRKTPRAIGRLANSLKSPPIYIAVGDNNVHNVHGGIEKFAVVDLGETQFAQVQLLGQNLAAAADPDGVPGVERDGWLSLRNHPAAVDALDEKAFARSGTPPSRQLCVRSAGSFHAVHSCEIQTCAAPIFPSYCRLAFALPACGIPQPGPRLKSWVRSAPETTRRRLPQSNK